MRFASQHDVQIALMKFLSDVAVKSHVADHVYVVGGAVRDFVLGLPIKDVDVVVDVVALGPRRDSAWFATQIQRHIYAPTNLVTNQYGVAILTIKGPFIFGGVDLDGEVIEIANSRKESYGGGEGKSYKPHMVEPADIGEDVLRREFNFNTLLWRLRDLAQGPDKAEVIDITGCGLRDLEQGVLSCPRDPNIVFSDDPTRMIRLIKFVGRYGFKVPPDVAAAVRRNADKIKSVPQNAIATILIRDVLEKSYAPKVLGLMVDLGLMDAVRDLAASDKAFRATLLNALRDASPKLLALLMGHGWAELARPKFLSAEQQGLFSEVVEDMGEEEAREFAQFLDRPPVDNDRFITEFALKGRDRAAPLTIAREILLDNPQLRDASQINDMIAARLSKRMMVGSYLKRAEVDPAIAVKMQLDYKSNLAAFRRAYDDTLHTLNQYGDTLEAWAAGDASIRSTDAFLTFIHGRNLVAPVAFLKAIPAKYRRLFETARREFARTRKFDHTAWFGKNIEILRMLYEADKWPDIAVDDDGVDGVPGAVTNIGSVRVVNQSGQDPTQAVDMVRKAIRALSDSSIPLITKALYGDVFVVGEVARKKTVAAWYYTSRDVIEVFAAKRFAAQQLRATIHEFGHRYWQKFVASDVKRAWVRHHDDMSTTTPDYEFPKVGEVLSYVQGRPTVTEVTPDRIIFEGGEFVIKASLVKFLRAQAREMAFPTPYAAKDAEEHFCESLSLFCLGDLKGPNLESFKTIVLGETLRQPELSLVASWGGTAGSRGVDAVLGLRAVLEYNSAQSRVYGVYKSTVHVGSLSWSKNNHTWSVYLHVNGDEDHKLRVHTFTSKDDREGVKLALMALAEHTTKGTLVASWGPLSFHATHESRADVAIGNHAAAPRYYFSMRLGEPVTSLKELALIAEKAEVNLSGTIFRQHLYAMCGVALVKNIPRNALTEVADWIRERYIQRSPPMMHAARQSRR